MIYDGPVFREMMDRFWKQKRFRTIPDYEMYLIGEQLNAIRKKEFEEEWARYQYQQSLKKKKGKKK